MTHLLALLLVQEPSGNVGGLSPVTLIQIPLIIAIFYFLFLRPQQKQKQAHDERIRNVKKGDEIVTAGGIIGKVENIKETMKDGTAIKSPDDRVTIRSGESRLVVERGRIARIITEPVVTEQKTA